MQPDELQDLDFSSMFEGITDKLAAESSASFLSKANSATYSTIKEELFMKLLNQYEYEVSQYLTNPNKVPSNLSALQEILTKHKNI